MVTYPKDFSNFLGTKEILWSDLGSKKTEKVPVGVLSVALFGHLQVHVGPYGDTLGDRDIFHALLNVCRYKFGILIHIYMPIVGCSGLEHVPDL